MELLDLNGAVSTINNYLQTIEHVIAKMSARTKLNLENLNFLWLFVSPFFSSKMFLSPVPEWDVNQDRAGPVDEERGGL